MRADKPVLAGALCLLLATHAAARSVVVATGSGAVRGMTEAGVSVFRGIPYAAPPVGALRWKPPQPVSSWPSVRSASAFGPACMQPSIENRGPNRAISEDCLYLNIWRPFGTKRGAKRPVMVWIHGGGFFFGSGAQSVYDGSALARNGVIVVTFNYRLGRFGWFADPALTQEAGATGTGDFGLMDDIAALKWVQSNIVEFGGDPTNVTVFGESAGGISVDWLMCTEAARGLFAKAITESGFGRVPATKLATAEKAGAAFADSVGATDLVALRKLPAEVVLGPEGHNTYPPLEGPWPILDGKLVSSDVDRCFAAGREAGVPWIVGSNDFEASLFPGQVADADATLAKLPDPERRTILALYDPDRQGDTKAVVAAMITDRLLSEPARFLAAGHAQAGYPVYRYLFATVAQGQRGKAPGAGHAAELPFVFGNFAPAERHGAADRRDAVVMGLYWTNFAKTGDPNGPGLPLWQADRDDAVLVFDNSGQHTIFKLRKPQLDEMEREAGGR